MYVSKGSEICQYREGGTEIKNTSNKGAKMSEYKNIREISAETETVA
jgi:hypothetical protein